MPAGCTACGVSIGCRQTASSTGVMTGKGCNARTMVANLLILSLVALTLANDRKCEGGQCEGDPALFLQQKHQADRNGRVEPGEPPYTLHDLGGKSVYLVMTDRFSRAGGQYQNDTSVCQGDMWCNGTLKGITSQLEYIRDMGFDCIWITPVVKNFYGPDGQSGYGYHGYWAEDYYQIDPNFGTKEDLKELIQETHNLGMCFILDIVLNHCRPVHSTADLNKVNPFNETAYIHQLNIGNLTFDQYTEKHSNWPPPAQALGPGAACALQYFPDGTPDSTNNGTYCNNYNSSIYNDHTYYGDRAHGPKYLKYCGPGNYNCKGYNQTVNLLGWFYDLADLNQSVPFVREGLKDWVRWLVQEFPVDGIRLDTTPFMNHTFLKEVQDMLMALDNPIHILGEVTSTNLTFHASYQVKDGESILGGMENFPLMYPATAGYCGSPNSILAPVAEFDLTYLGHITEQQQHHGLYSDTDLLMNMMDNQDETPIWGLYHVPATNPFQAGTGGCLEHRTLAVNSLAWLMFAKGMPVVTWGDEQGNTDYRNSLWQYNWNRTSWQYQLFGKMNAIRREKNVWKASTKVLKYTKWHLVFSRGCDSQQVIVFTNNLVQEPGDSVIYRGVKLPRAPYGMVWKDALRDQFFVVRYRRVVTYTTDPLVLVLERAPKAKSDQYYTADTDVDIETA